MSEIIYFSQLPTTSVWNGTYIDRTTHCPNCKFLKTVIDDTSNVLNGEEVCVWGVAWKRFSQTKKPRMCTKIGKENSQVRTLKGLEPREFH